MRALILLLALTTPAWADYVIVTQPTNVWVSPSMASTVLASVDAGDRLELISRRSTRGFYQVRYGDAEGDVGEVGYIDRESIRARTGNLGAVATRGKGRNSTLPGSVGVPSRTTSSEPAGDGSFDGCPLIGKVSPNASNKDELQQLNTEKNRSDFVKDADTDPNVTLAKMLAPGNDDSGRFKVGTPVRISGYVYDVKNGGVETCNCKATAPVDRDTHIELALNSPDDSEGTHHVIVEVTPRIRAAMANGGTDWSTDHLKKTLIGKWVTVTGWLFFDKEHVQQSENTNPGGHANWRATAWEVHPITNIVTSGEPIASN